MRFRAGTTEELPVVCVLAGGRGSRLGAQTASIPKPMVTVAGRPFVEHQLELLRRHGARRVVMCLGYLGHVVEEALGDGSRFGLQIRYSHDGPAPAGTAGAVRRALPLLDDVFMVLYGDTYLRIDYGDVGRMFRQSQCPALMTVLRNRGQFAPSNAVFSGGRVLAYDKRSPPPGAEWIDYGLSVFDRSVFDRRPYADLADLTRDLASARLLAGYEATERFYEIGTPEALAQTEAFLCRQEQLLHGSCR